MELNLKNDLSEITRVAGEVDDFVDNNRLERKLAFEINLVMEEIVTNIISYGYKGLSYDNEILISFDLQPESLIVTVRDRAAPFDPLQNPEPKIGQAVEDLPIGGLGIHLVKKMMDHLEYRRENDSNVLIMKKSIKKVDL